MTEQEATLKSRINFYAAPAAVLLALAQVACASQAPGSSNAQQDVVYSHHVHKMPFNYSASTPGPAGAHLTYYGGPVISNVKIVQVLYGAGTYAPAISGSQMSNFWTQVVVSPYTDTMSEYSTAGVTPSGGGTGSNQTIGRGSFGGKVQITPSAANSGASISDAQIQAELAAQISAGHLPSPDANTLYMINFPSGVAITQGTSSSCQAGGFCAYHGTFVRGGGDVFYGVLPDMSAASGCATGCGSNPTPFNNQTSVASHEFAEAITDAAVGLATTQAPPLAWYDATNGENGDICNAQQGNFVGGDGVTYTVQQIWSNAANACIDHSGTTPPPPPPPPPANDFSVSLSPSSATVAAGASATFAVATGLVSGSAQTISFAVSGLPTGASGSFSPSSVSAGQSATLTITTSSSASGSTSSFAVTGSATSGSHSASGSLTITSNTPPPPPPPPSGSIVNGDFETGTLAGWTQAGVAAISTVAHGGTSSARVGDTNPSTDSSLAQTFTLPSNATSLSFWYQVFCPDSITYDWASATLKDNSTGTTTTLLANTCTQSGQWVQATASVASSAGHSVTLTLANHDDNYAADPTYTLYDDVTLTTGTPPPPPPPPSGNLITNGGFEGSLSGWTLGGAKPPLDSVVHPHTGVNALRCGSSNGTGTDLNGDSNALQNVTIPSTATKATLSFWYYATSLDTIRYDWQDAQIRSASGAKLVNLFHMCSNSSVWTQTTVDVTAYKGKTIQVYFNAHDDGYSGDPTSLWVDDVSLTVQ